MSARIHRLDVERERLAIERQAECCASSIRYVLNGSDLEFIERLERAALLMTELARLLKEWQHVKGVSATSPCPPVLFGLALDRQRRQCACRSALLRSIPVT
jgi:hypothetical protein